MLDCHTCRPADRLLDQLGEVDYRAASSSTRFIFYGSDLVFGVVFIRCSPAKVNIYADLQPMFQLSGTLTEYFGMNLTVLHSHFLCITHQCLLIFFFHFFKKVNTARHTLRI